MLRRLVLYMCRVFPRQDAANKKTSVISKILIYFFIVKDYTWCSRPGGRRGAHFIFVCFTIVSVRPRKYRSSCNKQEDSKELETQQIPKTAEHCEHTPLRGVSITCVNDPSIQGKRIALTSGMRAIRNIYTQCKRRVLIIDRTMIWYLDLVLIFGI